MYGACGLVLRWFSSYSLVILIVYNTMGLVEVLFVVFFATTIRFYVEDRLDVSTWILHGS